ncbi:hypothetical protein Pint_17750 [Pistacia integerrima]|uniref:Uncharacterized protein n=1 Tax=Pistacia integerrima TaxID=434235 RepID=A0ACC0YWK3_9ROSI|nr:hypothetical protein Pint_17750 [Pistacia integerrima]
MRYLIYYSTIVARVHQVLKRKGLTGKRGQRVKVFKGACAGVHKNNIYATIDYFLIEGLHGDAAGDARIICRPIGLMDKEGCVLVENNGTDSLDIFGNLFAKDGEVPPREIVAVVRSANAVSSSPSKKLDQKHIPQSSCKSCERHVVVKGSSKVGNWRLLSCKQSPQFCVRNELHNFPSKDILIESYELDKIQPHYEATLVISPQDELALVSIPCQVILGSLKHVTIQSPNFGNNLLPGAMARHLKFEINEAN